MYLYVLIILQLKNGKFIYIISMYLSYSFIVYYKLINQM